MTDEAIRAAYIEGFMRGIEDAAKLVEGHIIYPALQQPLQKITKPSTSRWKGKRSARIVYAEAIRELKPETKNGR